MIALAGLLRSYIVEMARARISKDKRARVAARLVQFVESRQFDNPIAEIVHVATELQSMLFDEARQHKRTWERRWERYQTIQWDGEHIRRNVQLVLHGKQPESLGSRSLQALPRLPA